MTLAFGGEIGRAEPLEVRGDLLLRKHRVVLVDPQELGDPGKVLHVLERKAEPLGPGAGDLLPRRQRARTRARAKKRRALPAIDTAEEEIPVLVSQTHVMRRPALAVAQDSVGPVPDGAEPGSTWSAPFGRSAKRFDATCRSFSSACSEKRPTSTDTATKP